MTEAPVSHISTLSWSREVLESVLEELTLRKIQFQVLSGDLILEARFEDFVGALASEFGAGQPPRSIEDAAMERPRLESSATPAGASGTAPKELVMNFQSQQRRPQSSAPTSDNEYSDPPGFAKAGLVCGAISFFFFPIFLGILGIVLGAISWNQGSRLGRQALIVSVCGLIIGAFLGAMTWSSWIY